MLYMICFLSLVTTYLVADVISKLRVKKVDSELETLARRRNEATAKWVRWSRREK